MSVMTDIIDALKGAGLDAYLPRPASGAVPDRPTSP